MGGKWTNSDAVIHFAPMWMLYIGLGVALLLGIEQLTSALLSVCLSATFRALNSKWIYTLTKDIIMHFYKQYIS